MYSSGVPRSDVIQLKINFMSSVAFVGGGIRRENISAMLDTYE
jgi:hypothetical protein